MMKTMMTSSWLRSSRDGRVNEHLRVSLHMSCRLGRKRGWLGYLIDILRYTMCFFFSSSKHEAYTVTSCFLGQKLAACSTTHRSHVETAVRKGGLRPSSLPPCQTQPEERTLPCCLRACTGMRIAEAASLFETYPCADYLKYKLRSSRVPSNYTELLL